MFAAAQQLSQNVSPGEQHSSAFGKMNFCCLYLQFTTSSHCTHRHLLKCMLYRKRQTGDGEVLGIHGIFYSKFFIEIILLRLIIKELDTSL